METEIVNNGNGMTSVDLVVTPVKVGKRHYTKRGTTVMGKRIVLLNGNPVGRGRPNKLGKGKRMVVYIPVNESYDVNKHGVGMEYRATRHSTLRRLKQSNPLINLQDSVEIPVEVSNAIPSAF